MGVLVVDVQQQLWDKIDYTRYAAVVYFWQCGWLYIFIDILLMNVYTGNVTG